MRIGRFDFRWIDPPYDFGNLKSSCGCKFLYLGRLEITYFDKGCRCVVCDNYICECDGDKD